VVAQASFLMEAEPPNHRERGGVVRPNRGRHPMQPERAEGEVKNRAGRVGRVASAPVVGVNEAVQAELAAFVASLGVETERTAETYDSLVRAALVSA
jgi:hypothetical protein